MSDTTPTEKQAIESDVKTTIQQSRSLRDVALSEMELLERLSRKEADRQDRADRRGKGKRPWWKLR